MKKTLFFMNLMAASMLLILSCNDDFLNTTPSDTLPSEATWKDGALSEAFLFNIYSFLGSGGFEEQGLASLTDEAVFTHTGRNIDTFTEGSETPTNIAWTSETYSWNTMYLAIRHANTAIEQLPEATFSDTILRDRLLGEAYFLRAYYYHQLMRYYGGVPLIERTYSLEEDYTIVRNTFEESIQFIVADLDQAADLLEGKIQTNGRASEISAMALKSRVLLYAASDLHDGPTASANSAIIGGYPNPELVAYPSGNRSVRWEAAKTAAKAVLDATSGYKLTFSVPVSSEEGIANYVAIAMGGASTTADAAAAGELIFQRTQHSSLNGTRFGMNNGPNGYHNWAGNTPIQQLVDDYEMMDGSSFDWDNPAHANDPYTNRDPRFYATILYDGADWKPRPSDVAAIDPANQIQTGYYDDNKGDIINGVDTRESSIESWNGSRTHYYVRKFIDPDPEMPDNLSDAQLVPWPFIRYTEVVLNYIETCIETGDEGEAREWLNRIRYRAGMPAINDTGELLRARYRNERRIELAYEEHRYHDTRRWMIAPETINSGIQAIDIRAILNPGETPHIPYRYDPSKYMYKYTVVNNTETENRKWNDKMYYRPITRDEINRNEKLIQNPGYE